MFKTILKKAGIFFGYTVVGIYLLFLLLPLIANPFLSKYSEKISQMAEESLGLKLKIEKLGLVTSPNLSAGIKIGQLSVAKPDGEELVAVENIKAKLLLVPLIWGKIEADNFTIEDIDANLKVKPDGNLEIADFLPEPDENDTQEQLTELPMGLKLSNKMPNILIKEYLLSMTDMRNNRTYTLQGGNLKITNFVLNKSINISTDGKISLENSEQFKYNIKIKNRIMPDIDINDLIFAQNTDTTPQKQDTKPSEPVSFTIFNILTGIKQNGLTADTNCDLVIKGDANNPDIKGVFDIQKLSVLLNGKKLPDGHIKFDFQNKKAITDIKLYTADDETTTVTGEIAHGKGNLDLVFKSNAGINNIFELLKSLARTLNYNDLNTLSATGKVDADFKIKSDFKKLESSGHLDIPAATIKYGLYNLFIDKINADVDLNNNNLNIKNIGFAILQQPLKIYGTINQDTQTDLHLTADKLPIKGLIAIAGQLNLLKDNDIKSGTLTMDATLKGYLKDIKPLVNLTLANINIYNKPATTTVKLNSADLKLSTDGKTYNGDIEANTLAILNPAANITLPKIKLTLNEKDINIDNTYLLFSNSRIDLKGKISNYPTKDILIDMLAKGSIVANDIKPFVPQEYRSMITFKGSMPILTTVTGNDKHQTVNFQLLATPDGYIHVADLQSVSNKSMLLNSKINIQDNNITLENTGAYSTDIKALSENPATNLGGNPILKISGGISNLSNMTLNALKISTPQELVTSIPMFSNSKANVNINLTLNGNVMAPEIKGDIKVPSVVLPTMKTTLKNITVDFAKVINVNLPEITVADSTMSAKANINSDFRNGIILPHVDFKATKLNSDTLLAELAKMPASSSSGSNSGDIGIIIQNGNGAISNFITGQITATNLTSDFNLKNNIFTLKNLTGNSFNGKIDGKISANVVTGKTDVTLKAENMKAVDAIAAAAGIQNALSGTLGFDTKLTLNAFESSYDNLLKSVKGNINFSVKDGNYMNIGTLDKFIFAGNITSNILLKTALEPIKRMPVVQNSSRFSSITGQIDLNNGVAKLSPVKSTGNSIAYYVVGTYNILNGYTNVTILGRMGADVVAVLGPLGQLSASKLTSFLPNFGSQTLALLNTLTANPKQENTAQLPALSSGSTNYKDFKVVFNGNVTNPTSVKTFKWLSECDTSGIENGSLKEQMKTSIDSIKQSGQNNINEVKRSVETTKQNIEQAKTEVQNKKEEVQSQIQKTKNSIEELKKLKDALKNPPASSTKSTTPAAE